MLRIPSGLGEAQFLEFISEQLIKVEADRKEADDRYRHLRERLFEWLDETVGPGTEYRQWVPGTHQELGRTIAHRIDEEALKEASPDLWDRYAFLKLDIATVRAAARRSPQLRALLDECSTSEPRLHHVPKRTAVA